MKRNWYVVAAVIATCLLFALWFVLAPSSHNREELVALPGGVAYREGLTTVPDLFQEAKTFLEKRELAQAEMVYRKIVAAEPDNAPGYVGIGSCRFWQEDLQGAEKHYQKALMLAPRSTQALLGLAGVAVQRGHYAAAVDYYERVRAIYENLADVHWGLAISQDELNRNEEALRHYERFLELAPKSALADRAQDRITELREEVSRKP